MEEQRIDLSKISEDYISLAQEQEKIQFELNHTYFGAPEYSTLLSQLFKAVGNKTIIKPPMTVVHGDKVEIGHNTYINPHILMMAAGGIFIGNNVQIAAYTKIITNNHDLYNRAVITCRPVLIADNCWIGAGAILLPGVSVGENSVVGAGSVVTKDVPPNTVVAGNPAKIIRELDNAKFQ